MRSDGWRPSCPHPALLLLLLGLLLLQAAHAGVAGDAVQTGDALRRVLTPDLQLCPTQQ